MSNLELYEQFVEVSCDVLISTIESFHSREQVAILRSQPAPTLDMEQLEEAELKLDDALTKAGDVRQAMEESGQNVPARSAALEAKINKAFALLETVRGDGGEVAEEEDQPRHLTTTLLAPAPSKQVTFAEDPVVHEYEQPPGTMDPQARLEETRALLDDLRRQTTFTGTGSIDDVPLSQIQRAQSDERFNNTKGNVLSEINLTARELEMDAPMDDINNDMDNINTAAELTEYRAKIIRLLYANRAINNIERVAGPMSDEDKEEILADYELVPAEHDDLKAKLQSDAKELEEALAETEKANMLRDAAVATAQKRIEATAGPRNVRPGDALSQAEQDAQFAAAMQATRDKRTAADAAWAASKAPLTQAEQDAHFYAAMRATKPSDFDIIPSNVVEKEIDYIVNKMPGSNMLDAMQRASIELRLRRMAQRDYSGFWELVEKEQQFVTSLAARNMQIPQTTSLVSPPVPAAPKQRRARTKSAAPAKPAASAAGKFVMPNKVVAAPGFKAAPSAAPAPAAIAAPAPAAKVAGEPSKTQMKKAQAMANKWWKAHPRGKTRDMNTTSKTVVTMARDYKPGKNDFKGLDDGSRGYRVKW